MNVAVQTIASSDAPVVVGLGTTGLSCARYFHALGLSFSVVDTRVDPPGLKQLRIEMPEVPVYAGEYPEELITGAAEIIVSPGVAMDDPLVKKAQSAGVEVRGDIDLFVREAKAPIVGITGSNAKSTVTELLGQMARDAGINVGVGGNLGVPALALLSPECELYVLELSSFQLERASGLGLSVATVLNVSADHLDRHHDITAYQQAKHRIFQRCKCAVLNRDDASTIPLLPADVAQVSWRMAEPERNGFGLRVEGGVEYLCHKLDEERVADVATVNILATRELGTAGRHNVANALSALALGHCAGLPLETMAATLRSFSGLAHRCEQISQVGGVTFVNDSKGTNVGATQAALEGLGVERNIVLIAGGQGKGADFSVLHEAIAQHCKHLILIGEDAALLAGAFCDAVAVSFADSMLQAVKLAVEEAAAGDTVLLSPACASFDMFSGYEERGESFRNAVSEVAGSAQ